jgi:hypothetical protein
VCVDGRGGEGKLLILLMQSNRGSDFSVGKQKVYLSNFINLFSSTSAKITNLGSNRGALRDRLSILDLASLRSHSCILPSLHARGRLLKHL